MRSLVLRVLIILTAMLATATWYPYSLIPLWTMLLATHFFSIREGLICLAGFSILGLVLNYGFPFFFILWACFVVSIFIKMLSPNGKISLVQFALFTLSASILAQVLFYKNAYPVAFVTTLRHIIFLTLLVLPAKILGDAYQRYFNALGRNYE